MKTEPRISIVAAMSAHDRAIGKEGKLLWHIPDDLKRFKALTLGHPVIMGRKTFESIVGYLGGPLSGRANLVVSRNPDYEPAGAEVFHSLEDVLVRARELENEEIHIGGGSDLYAQALPHTDRLYLTLVDDRKDADTYFPDYSYFTKEISREEREHNGLRYTWLTLERG